jgi:hypothetical protein
MSSPYASSPAFDQPLNSTDSPTFVSTQLSKFGPGNAGIISQISIDPLYGLNFETNDGSGLVQKGAVSLDEYFGSLNFYNRTSLASVRVTDAGFVLLGPYYQPTLTIDGGGNVSIPYNTTSFANGTAIYNDGSASFSYQAAQINADGSAWFSNQAVHINANGSASFLGLSSDGSVVTMGDSLGTIKAGNLYGAPSFELWNSIGRAAYFYAGGNNCGLFDARSISTNFGITINPDISIQFGNYASGTAYIYADGSASFANNSAQINADGSISMNGGTLSSDGSNLYWNGNLIA